MLRKLISIFVIALLIMNTASFVFADSPYSVTVTTNKQAYTVGEEVRFTVTMTKASQAYVGSPLTIKIYSGDTIVFTDQGVTDLLGKYINYYTIGRDDNAGEYTVAVNAGGVVSTTTFTLSRPTSTPRPADPTPTPTPGPVAPPVVPNNPETKSNPDGSVDVVVKSPVLENATGTAVAALNQNLVAAALESAKTNSEGNKVVNIEISEVANAKGYELQLPASAISSANSNTVIAVETKLGTVSIPANVLSNSASNSDSKVGISIKAVDKTTLPKDIQEAVGNRPILDLNIIVDGKEKAWSSEDTKVKVTVAYTPTAEELKNLDNITVWYIDNNGKVQTISNAKYDKSSGTISFYVTHFSKYAVTFVNKSFTDIDSVKAWAGKEIYSAVAKDLIKEKAAGKFEPKANITRGEFIYGIVRALGLTAKTEGNFKDVASSDYYYNELAVAKKLGIAYGVGDNTYKPTDSITRQDMATLIQRALVIAKKQGKVNADLSKFADNKKIASYAVDSIKAVAGEGILQGDGKNINPTGTATRAETAAILYRIFNK